VTLRGAAVTDKKKSLEVQSVKSRRQVTRREKDKDEKRTRTRKRTSEGQSEQKVSRLWFLPRLDARDRQRDYQARGQQGFRRTRNGD